MDRWGEGVGPGTWSWVGAIGDLKGGLGNAAGAEEGVPVGGARGFVKRVVCFIA